MARGIAVLALTLAAAGPASAATAHRAAADRALRPTKTAKAASSRPIGGATLAPTAQTNSNNKPTAQASDGGHVYPGDSQHLGDRILRQGMSGHDVRVLQDYLTIAGFATNVDGQFGPATKANVIAFQRAHHLTADGVVTYSVSQVLRAAVAAAVKSMQSSPGPAGKGRVVGGLAVAPSNAPPAVKAVIAAANRIAFKPYIYGGGHGSWNDSGYDCSGSVSYALHGAGLLSSPEDSTELESYGSPGGGHWISIWANSGHTYMYVAGLRFDTSAQGETGGSRWTTGGRSNAGFVERHPGGL